MDFTDIDPLLRAALREDIGGKDLTTTALIPKSLHVKADIEIKEPGVICGLTVAERVFRLVDDSLRFLPVAKEGDFAEEKREIAYIEGPALSVLIAERVALNLLGHLSGIATKTRFFVEAMKGTKAKIYDTRKTTPNLRVLDKYAVKVGGGENHRMGLYDQVLIKDNHLRILRKESIPDIVARVRRSVLKKTIVGIEVRNLAELREALKTPVDYVLLDNMSPAVVRQAVDLRKKVAPAMVFEVSGGVKLDNVRDYAEAGVERISVGSLTHSFKSIDVSLDIVA